MRATLRAVQPSHVLHLAWYVEHGRFWAAPENLDWVGATLSLARAAAEAGATRFVGTGTCIEYDWSDQESAGQPGLRRESDPLAPTFLYGEAKAACYRLLSAAAPGLGLSFAWGRLFHLFGPGENPARLVASLIAAMRAGKAAEIGSGRQLRDFMATQDAGAALAALCASGVTGAVNVASGEAGDGRSRWRRRSPDCWATRPVRIGRAPRPARRSARHARGRRPALRREVGFRRRRDEGAAAPRPRRLDRPSHWNGSAIA